MDTAWPPSQGEALHTSTFLGHPVGCAMALANIAELRSKNLVRTSERLGSYLLQRLQSLRGSNLSLSPRGLGLMAGVELRKRDGAPATGDVWRIINDMLRRGFIMLPEGEHGNVLSFTPPLTITRQLLDAVVRNLSEVLQTL
jgi:4-aminobutyrate aminotransferase-like enzyme